MSVGTPDFTRGVVSAQKEVGSFTHAVTNGVVSIPPNAETLVVVIPSAPAAQACSVAGNTSAAAYPAIRAGLQGGSVPSAVFFIDVSSAIDPTMTISIAPAAPGNWFVYADAGVHLTADIGGVLDSQGKHFHVPVVPGTTSFDHPPTELQHVAASLATGGQVLPAPGALFRYRIFSASVGQYSGAGNSWMNDTSGVQFYQGSSVSSGFQYTYGPTGIVMATNSPIALGLNGGTATAMLTYTLELA